MDIESGCQPSFSPLPDQLETPQVQSVINKLKLLKHPEGGYFVETDRDTHRVPNPFIENGGSSASTRSASTTIYYFLTPAAPQGMFHRNKARTMHTLHWGRGRYVVIHADEQGGGGGKARVETFVVGKDIEAGERMQWMVDGGKFKASFLLPDAQDCNGKNTSGGLLISEACVVSQPSASTPHPSCAHVDQGEKNADLTLLDRRSWLRI